MRTASGGLFFANNPHFVEGLVIERIPLGIDAVRGIGLTIFRLELLRVQLPVDLNLPLLEQMHLIAG